MFNSSSKHHGLCGGRGCRLRHDHLQAEVVTPLFGKLGWYDQVVQEDPRRFALIRGHIGQIRVDLTTSAKSALKAAFRSPPEALRVQVNPRVDQ